MNTRWTIRTAAALLAAPAAAHAAAGDAELCRSPERFSRRFEEIRREAFKDASFRDAAAGAAARARMIADAKALCPELPWDEIESVASRIADDDVAVRYGTSNKLYGPDVFANQLGSAAKSAIGECKGAMFLARCLSELTCRTSGSNSCMCMTPDRRVQLANVCH